MKKKSWIILIVIALVCLFLFGCIGVLLVSAFFQKGSIVSNKIALIRINGVITSSGVSGDIIPTAGTSSEKVIRLLRRADRDPSVSAILLRIDSPGGSAAASEEIYEEIRRVKKPVVASIGDIGASGAYYSACAADKIVASYSSDVGSIGVIYAIPNLQELYKKLGIEYVVIAEGKHKDMYSSLRPLTEEEKEIIRKEVRIVYEHFIDSVVKARGAQVLGKRGKLSKADRLAAKKKVRRLATGETFPGIRAKELGLVDKLGNFSDAVDLAAKLGKIKGKPELIEYGAPTLWDAITQFLQEARMNLYKYLLLRDLQSFPSQTR